MFKVGKTDKLRGTKHTFTSLVYEHKQTVQITRQRAKTNMEDVDEI